MPTSPSVAFKHRSICLEDGVHVLTPMNAVTAALEAGYPIPLGDTVNASNSTTIKGYFTESEFNELLQHYKKDQLTPNAVALAVLLVSSDNEITRATLEKAFPASSVNEPKISESEIDKLFNLIDTAHTGMITCEQFMTALFGAEGVVALEQERYILTLTGYEKLSFDEHKKREKERLEKEREKKNREAQEKERLEKERAEREKQERLAMLQNQKKESGCC